MAELENRLVKFLEDAGEWEALPVEKFPGVSIVKMPKTKNRPSKLSLVINPVKDGKPIKRKGLFVTSAEMFLEFAEVLQNDSVYNLMKSVDDINDSQQPEKKSRKPLKID